RYQAAGRPRQRPAPGSEQYRAHQDLRSQFLGPSPSGAEGRHPALHDRQIPRPVRPRPGIHVLMDWRPRRSLALLTLALGAVAAGFVVVDGRIDHVRVLVYRESRGQEVRTPSFLKQFKDAKLTRGDRLDREIDGIAGATLSVGAMEHMARLALFFDQTGRR